MRSSAQDSRVEALLSADSILIGEKIALDIRVKSDERLNSVFILDEGLFPPAIELLSKASDSTLRNDENVYSFRYEGIVFDTGTFRINPVQVLLNRSGSRDTLFSPELFLDVHYPEVDTSAAIRDIKSPVNTPLTLAEIREEMYIGLGVLLLILIGIMVFRYFRKRKSDELREKVYIPPHVKALSGLDKLKKEKGWQKGQVKEYYSDLSDIMRTYLEERYGFPAMESITQEILEQFAPYGYDDDFLMETLEKMLSMSDLVKFAKEDPGPMENETHLNNAYIFVEKTKEKEEVETELATSSTPGVQH
jgi:hypothetical protein